MKEHTYEIKSLTPIFSYGADQSVPKIRASSIRGMLRWWALAIGEKALADDIFGKISKDAGKARASKVILRVDNIKATVEDRDKLPHKRGRYASPTRAYVEGSSFEMTILERRTLTEEERAFLLKLIDIWLMLGTLGGRATRGGGNLCYCDPQKSFSPLEEWDEKASSFLKGTPLRACILAKVDGTDSAIRKIFTDTIKLPKNDFPLGITPSREDRTLPTKISPLKFKLVEIAKDKYIAAIWDGRDNTDADLKFAIDELSAKNKPIGGLLKSSNLYKNLI